MRSICHFVVGLLALSSLALVTPAAAVTVWTPTIRFYPQPYDPNFYATYQSIKFAKRVRCEISTKPTPPIAWLDTDPNRAGFGAASAALFVGDTGTTFNQIAVPISLSPAVPVIPKNYSWICEGSIAAFIGGEWIDVSKHIAGSPNITSNSMSYFDGNHQPPSINVPVDQALLGQYIGGLSAKLASASNQSSQVVATTIVSTDLSPCRIAIPNSWQNQPLLSDGIKFTNYSTPAQLTVTGQINGSVSGNPNFAAMVGSLRGFALQNSQGTVTVLADNGQKYINETIVPAAAGVPSSAVIQAAITNGKLSSGSSKASCELMINVVNWATGKSTAMSILNSFAMGN